MSIKTTIAENNFTNLDLVCVNNIFLPKAIYVQKESWKLIIYFRYFSAKFSAFFLYMVYLRFERSDFNRCASYSSASNLITAGLDIPHPTYTKT